MFTNNATRWTDYFFVFMLLFLAIPGMLALYFGGGLIHDSAKANIKGAIGALTIGGAVVFAGMAPDLFPAKYNYELMLLLISILLMPVYVYAAKYVILHTDCAPVVRCEFLGKGIFKILAIQIWLVATGIMETHILSRGYPSHFGKEFLIRVGPLIIAVVFYKVCARLRSKICSQTTPCKNL